jgi:hypothetical protein
MGDFSTLYFGLSKMIHVHSVYISGAFVFTLTLVILMDRMKKSDQ